MQKIRACTFTGHRPKSLPWGYDENHADCIKLKNIMEHMIIKLIGSGVYYYLSGMAEGTDMYGAELILKLKSTYPTLFLECAIPHEEQGAAWSNAQRERYFSIIEKCDKETLLQRKFSKDCYDKRNQYLVSQADIVLAVSKGTRSGTENTVSHARKQGKKIILINPLTFDVEEI